MKLQEIVQLDFEILVVDGLRIGGGGGDLEIGATIEGNLAVVRDAATDEPYIPGSSLKGKLRSLAEKVDGTFEMSRDRPPQRLPLNDGSPCKCGSNLCRVCPIYGAHMNTRAECAPTRIKVRDAHFTPPYRLEYEKKLKESGQYLEHKTENLVNRKSGTAEHPRTGERVPPGARFAARIILHIYDSDQNRKAGFLASINQALGLLENADSLGASGSRGFGAIKLENLSSKTTKVADVAVAFQAS